MSRAHTAVLSLGFDTLLDYLFDAGHATAHSHRAICYATAQFISIPDRDRAEDRNRFVRLLHDRAPAVCGQLEIFLLAFGSELPFAGSPASRHHRQLRAQS
jgi:hypothetical protein